jgi:predicted DNA-binding protein (MmcQ/YjbR family)
MNIESLRRCCLSLPHATEHVQWGDNLVFKVGGKMFAIANIDLDAPHKLSLKTEPETMAALLEQPGIVPAPYLARCHWVALEAFDALSDGHIRALLERAHGTVLAALPRKTRAALTSPSSARPRTSSSATKPKRRASVPKPRQSRAR